MDEEHPNPPIDVKLQPHRPIFARGRLIMKRYDYITPIDDKRYETLTLSCIVNDSKLNPDSIL